ncbi:MAG: MarR family winged helix-turn-helix transcriptional regulator [Leifsonia sp.]
MNTGSTDIDPIDTAIAEVEEAMTVLSVRVQAQARSHAAKVHEDLRPVGYTILSSLAHSGPTSASVLAERLSTDKSVLSRQVRCMQEYGLLESRLDPADKRARVIAATPAALAAMERARVENAALLRDRLREWPTADIARFADMIGRIRT